MKVDGNFFKSTPSSHWLLVILLYCSFKVGSRQVKPIQCKDDSGNSVDWIYAYKFPRKTNVEEPHLSSGTAYLYFSNNDNKWHLSKKSIGDYNSFLGYTLNPLYDERKEKSLFYLAYNDDPPQAEVTTVYAHAKGVVATDISTGFWLVHSSPNFPEFPNPGNSLYYTFPPTASKYGQSFLCISLLITQMEKIGELLQMMRPKIYKNQIPSKFRKKLPELVGAAEGKHTRHEPWTVEKKLQTIQGFTFSSFSKSKYFNKDLYSEWLVTELKSPLDVETWMNGPNPLKSDCEKPLTTLNVREINLKIGNKTYDFLSTRDHSKWAVSGEMSKPWICVGDINRMASQFKRGGGTVCALNLDVWKAYFEGIKQVDACPIKNTTIRNQDIKHSFEQNNFQNEVFTSTVTPVSRKNSQKKNVKKGNNNSIKIKENEDGSERTPLTIRTLKNSSEHRIPSKKGSRQKNTKYTTTTTKPTTAALTTQTPQKRRRRRKQALKDDDNYDQITQKPEEKTTEVTTQSIVEELTSAQTKSPKQRTTKKSSFSKTKKGTTEKTAHTRSTTSRPSLRKQSKRRREKLNYRYKDEYNNNDNDDDDDDPDDEDFDWTPF